MYEQLAREQAAELEREAEREERRWQAILCEPPPPIDWRRGRNTSGRWIQCAEAGRP